MLNFEALQLIKNSALFRDVEESALASVLESCQTLKLKSNSTLYKTEDPADQVYFILDGVVQLYLGSDDGKHAVLGIREKGDVAGLTSALSGRSNYSNAKTVRKCTTLAIPAPVLHQVIAQSPSTGERLMRRIADNLTGISRHVERLQLLQTTERLADYLLDTVNDGQTSIALTLPCDKGLIATYLGMERESFSRALAKLRSVGVITKGRHIEITDTLALKQLRDQPT